MKRIAASISFFTRIPIWKWVNIPQEYYKDTVVYWSLSGWITGAVTAFVLWLAANVTGMVPAVIIALLCRVLLTGGLHEDGLADFCDGFGGGHSKEQILTIMKDSHIGTYGVTGIIFYFLLYVALISSLPLTIAIVAVFTSDVFAKACSAQIVNFLPYARPEGAKNKINYAKMNSLQLLIAIIFGIAPLALYILINPYLLLSLFLPVVSIIILILVMKNKLGGYTGDCCGASCLICELIMILGINIMFNLI